MAETTGNMYHVPCLSQLKPLQPARMRRSTAAATFESLTIPTFIQIDPIPNRQNSKAIFLAKSSDELYKGSF